MFEYSNCQSHRWFITCSQFDLRLWSTHSSRAPLFDWCLWWSQHWDGSQRVGWVDHWSTLQHTWGTHHGLQLEAFGITWVHRTWSHPRAQPLIRTHTEELWVLVYLFHQWLCHRSYTLQRDSEVPWRQSYHHQPTVWVITVIGWKWRDHFDWNRSVCWTPEHRIVFSPASLHERSRVRISAWKVVDSGCFEGITFGPSYTIPLDWLLYRLEVHWSSWQHSVRRKWVDRWRSSWITRVEIEGGVWTFVGLHISSPIGASSLERDDNSVVWPNVHPNEHLQFLFRRQLPAPDPVKRIVVGGSSLLQNSPTCSLGRSLGVWRATVCYSMNWRRIILWRIVGVGCTSRPILMLWNLGWLWSTYRVSALWGHIISISAWLICRVQGVWCGEHSGPSWSTSMSVRLIGSSQVATKTSLIVSWSIGPSTMSTTESNPWRDSLVHSLIPVEEAEPRRRTPNYQDASSAPWSWLVWWGRREVYPSRTNRGILTGRSSTSPWNLCAQSSTSSRVMGPPYWRHLGRH